MRTQKLFNRVYYNTSEGVYSSFWAGKLTNSLMQAGNKQTIEIAMKQAYSILKLTYKILPITILLESLQRTKPLFGVGFVIIAGKRKDFPFMLSTDRQLNLAIRWLKNAIVARREWYLSQRICLELYEVRYSKSPTSSKIRNALMDKAIDNRFNARYAY